MTQSPQLCKCCQQLIPKSGFGYAAHMKMHVRKGEARVEYNERYSCHEYIPTKVRP